MLDQGVDPRDLLALLALALDPHVLEVRGIGQDEDVPVDDEVPRDLIELELRQVLILETLLLQSEDLELPGLVHRRKEGPLHTRVPAGRQRVALEVHNVWFQYQLVNKGDLREVVVGEQAI